MRRSGPLGLDPDDEAGSPLSRIKRAVSAYLARGRPEQALPLTRYRGQPSPVVPYRERREQLLRARRQHSSYALIFILILLVLVVGLFYGLTWALGNLSLGGGSSRATPTVSARAPVTAPTDASPTPIPAPVILPTAAPGGNLQASPGPSPAPGASPAPGPGTPDAGGQRTYTVKAGDTPSGIAREFGVSTDALMRANNITDARTLRPGVQLTIPPAPTPSPGPR